MDEERTILLVEADEKIRDAIKNSLADKPCRFVEVESADDAIMQFAVEGPNLVVTSLEMPDGDGVELLKNLRDFDAKVPIIVMMGEPTKEKIVASKKARAADILLKPPDYERIMTRISNSLWIDPSLIKSAEEEELDFETELKKNRAEMKPPDEPMVEAIPKGAEILNINDVAAGMVIAKTLMFNDVVFGDKGQTLTDVKIKRYSRQGVMEVCVYIDEALKKKVAAKKKAQAQSASIKTNDSGAAVSAGDAPSRKVFAKVKRAAVRVKTAEPADLIRTSEDGSTFREKGEIADMSAGGCALLTKGKLNRGEEFEMSFTLDEGRFKMEGIKGIVRHSMHRFGTEDYPQRNGIFFTNVTERFRENLITVLFRLERENKKKEDDLRARYGYAPRKRRKKR